MLRQAPSRRSQYPLDTESLSDVRQLLISFSLKHTIINFIHSMNTKHSFSTPSPCHNQYNHNMSHVTCRYGSRVPTEHCSLAVVVMSIQSIVGVVIQVSSMSRVQFDQC